MPHTLLRSFARFEDARSARDQLVAAGLPASAVEVRSLEDEAGPVEGNFAIGNGRVARGSRDAYDLNFAPASQGTNLLVVEVEDHALRDRAESMLEGLGGTDPGTAGGPRSGN